jgi:hypothetical protein
MHSNVHENPESVKEPLLQNLQCLKEKATAQALSGRAGNELCVTIREPLLPDGCS